MDLSNIVTLKLLFDPKKEGFEQEMIDRSPVFDIKSIDRRKALTYIILAFDINSEVRRNQRELLQRKSIAAQIAGFKTTNNFFDEDAEDMIVGENDEVNKAIVEYVYLMFNNDYKLLYVLEERYNETMALYKTTARAFSEGDRKHLTNMKEQIEEIESVLFGGTEVLNVRKALYEGIDGARLRIRAEDRVENKKLDPTLDIFNPFPGYKTPKLRFAGDKIPDK